MSNLFWNIIKTTPVLLGAVVVGSQGAIAAPDSGLTAQQPQLLAQAAPNTQLDPASQELLMLMERNRNSKVFNSTVDNDPMSQVTNVNQLRDVEPTAWAYEALRSLVERYGCIVGYPDRTYRGDRALTRWEFAAGLNACLNVMERLIQENVAVLKEDIDKLKRLAQEFEAELAALGARVDNLEARVSFLEDHQFSTTTKLKGEVIFSLADSFSEAVGSDRDESQTAFNDRIRLNLETSFTGKDLLKTRLQAGNFDTTFNARGVTGTNMTRLAYDNGSGNNVTIDDLFYRFPLTDKGTAWIGANGLDLDDVFQTLNPFMESSGTGALSRLQRYNNMVYKGPEGAGLAFRYKFSSQINATVTYLASGSQASNPSESNGLFNGSFSTGGQIVYTPTKGLDIGATYVHNYTNRGGLFGGVTDANTNSPFGNTPTTAERFGVQGNWRVSDGINLNLFGGYGFAEAQDGSDRKIDFWNVNGNVSFVDLGKEGAVLTLGGGVPISRSGDTQTAYMIEGQYKYPITKNILITPGVYVVFNPVNNDQNPTQVMGVVRTTFQF